MLFSNVKAASAAAGAVLVALGLLGSGMVAHPAQANSSEGAKPVETVKVASVDAKEEARGSVPAPAKKQPASTSLRISINLTNQTMTVKEHGKAKYHWPISSGRKGYRTPTGNWRPKWMTTMHYSRKYDNAPMPYSIFFHGGYAIHATYATGRLGGPASHGCIRLSPANAKKLYKLVLKHTRARTMVSIRGVARDTTRTYAKKKTYRRSGSAASNAYGASQRSAPKRVKRSYRKPSYANNGFGFYGSQKYVWPGDNPRLRY